MRPDFEVVEDIITVPDDHGSSIVQSGSSDVHRYYDPAKSVVILEYTMHGTVVKTLAPYVNRFISVIEIKDREIVHWRDCLDPLTVFAAFGDALAPGAQP